MGMDPATAMLIASVGTQVASTGLGLSSSKQQARTERATSNAEAASAGLQVANQAFENVLSFRQAMASQLALASLRGQGGSITRQVTSQSMASFYRDQKVFAQRQQSIDLSRNISQSNVTSSQFARDARSAGSLLQTALNTGFTAAKDVDNG